MRPALLIGLASLVLFPMPARAADICGWYAIAFCSRSQDAARDFSGRGWGAVVSTNGFKGFKSGFYCVLSGPQSKASARRDMQMAMADGVAPDMYIKRACADDSLIGD